MLPQVMIIQAHVIEILSWGGNGFWASKDPLCKEDNDDVKRCPAADEGFYGNVTKESVCC